MSDRSRWPILDDRLTSVSAETAQLLRTAALLGGRFAVTDLAVVARRTVAAVAANMQEAVAADIVADAGPELAFRHPLIRQALYESMPEALRTALHAEAARELAAAGADALTVGQQLSAGRRPGADWARSWLIQAGHALTTRAPQLAVELLRRELDETPVGDEAWDALIICLVRALLAAADYPEAALHRRAATWPSDHGQVVDAIRHTQAAGDWSAAARLLADHSFGLTLDGYAQTAQALVRAFPSGEDHPELALVRAGTDLVQGRLDEAAAHLAVAETYTGTAPPDRQRRLRVAIASLQLSLARRRGDLAGVVEQVRFLGSPVTGQSDEDIALDSDLRAVALMNLGTVEAWSLALPDAERHLLEGAALARIG